MSFWSTADSSLNSYFTLLSEKIKTILFIKKPYNKRWLLNPINSNSHLLSRYVFNRRSGDNLLKCQLDSSCVIMFLILMTTLFYKAMLLQGEIWRWSLLGLIEIWCRVNSHQDGDLWKRHLIPAPGGGFPCISHRAGFLCRFGLKTGIHFPHFDLESGMVFEGTTGVCELIHRFYSKWVHERKRNMRIRNGFEEFFVCPLI